MNKSEYQKNLISYLYDEWEGSEKESFQEELKKHPEWEAELDILSGVMGKLQEAKAPSVTPPKLDLSHSSTKQNSLNGFSFLKSPWIQAAIVAMLLMCTAALTGFDLSWTSKEGFSLKFGKQVSPTNVVADASSPYQEDQQQLLRQISSLSQQLARREDSLYQRMESLYSQVDDRIKLQQRKSQSLSQEVHLSEDQFASIRKELLRENYQLMTDLMEYAAEYQRNYNEQMLGEFATYLNTQRSEDLQMISLALQEILQQNDIQQQETEILLGQLITHFSSD